MIDLAAQHTHNCAVIAAVLPHLPPAELAAWMRMNDGWNERREYRREYRRQKALRAGAQVTG
jgi:hypothetical protein